jgi:hypothetical protein
METNLTPQPSATMQNVGESRKVIAIQVNLREINALIDRLIESVHDQWENSGQLEAELKSVVSRLAEHAEGRMPTPQPSDVGEIERLIIDLQNAQGAWAIAVTKKPPNIDAVAGLTTNKDNARNDLLAAVRTLAGERDALRDKVAVLKELLGYTDDELREGLERHRAKTALAGAGEGNHE